METPFTTHITPENYKYVYEPAEDSFLLLDALEEDIPYLKGRSILNCVEIGSGSGIIITALSKLFQSSSHCIAVDINRYACSITKGTSEKNNAKLDVVQMNLLSMMKSKAVDLLIFNPPYVPTSSSECISAAEISENYHCFDKNLVNSWAGGTDGVEIVYKLLDDLDRILTNDGTFYLLLIKENKPEKIMKYVERFNFLATIIKERKIRGEHLHILKVIRKSSIDI